MSPHTRALWCVGAGLVLAVGAARAVGLPASDSAQLIALSFGIAVGAYGLGVTTIRRRANPIVVALIPTVAVLVGALASARAMFVSSHDLAALLVVTIGAGTAGVLGALALAAELDRSRAAVEAAANRERLVERSRRELVAWVSHDLRTPLAGIRAMVEALDDGVVDDPAEVRTYHGRLVSESERLAHLVDDLFELSRIEANALQLTLELISLGQVVSDAVASATVLAEARGVRVDGLATAPPSNVQASERELSRVVHNLLDNAIRHTPPGGSVLVEVGGDEDHAELSVRDECGGIPEHDLDRVFDLAYRGDPARSPASHAGAGLGLAIARGFVEAHRGAIGVRNEDGGCRFTVRLPRAGVAAE
ncbi:MAG: HAMP domain-containing histidine kinase [Acidimicrobiia bacterium]|nr:HAMP domain-containing histidine kinase [Acidimicrobiia bacterium]